MVVTTKTKGKSKQNYYLSICKFHAREKEHQSKTIIPVILSSVEFEIRSRVNNSLLE